MDAIASEQSGRGMTESALRRGYHVYQDTVSHHGNEVGGRGGNVDPSRDRLGIGDGRTEHMHQRLRFELQVIIPNSQKRTSCKEDHSRVEIGSKYYIAD